MHIKSWCKIYDKIYCNVIIPFVGLRGTNLNECIRRCQVLVHPQPGTPSLTARSSAPQLAASLCGNYSCIWRMICQVVLLCTFIMVSASDPRRVGHGRATDPKPNHKATDRLQPKINWRRKWKQRRKMGPLRRLSLRSVSQLAARGLRHNHIAFPEDAAPILRAPRREF